MAVKISLEDVFLKETKNNEDIEELWHKYKTMEKDLAKAYYPWIQANLPYFTDHGEKHISSIIRIVNELLRPVLLVKTKKELTGVDIFILLSSIIWHDVGMVDRRSGHEARVQEIGNHIQKTGFPQPILLRTVLEIVKAHSGRDGLKIPKNDEYCTLTKESFTFHPKALAAILRFADEISEDRNRISMDVYEKVPDDQQIYWQYANAISSCIADPERGRVVVNIELDVTLATQRFICKEYPDRVDAEGKISLIEYIVCRLEKMNTERSYCSVYFSRYVQISEIEARFTILNRNMRVEEYEKTFRLGDSGINSDEYQLISIYEDFFKNNPRWTPEKIGEVFSQ